MNRIDGIRKKGMGEGRRQIETLLHFFHKSSRSSCLLLFFYRLYPLKFQLDRLHLAPDLRPFHGSPSDCLRRMATRLKSHSGSHHALTNAGVILASRLRAARRAASRFGGGWRLTGTEAKLWSAKPQSGAPLGHRFALPQPPCRWGFAPDPRTPLLLAPVRTTVCLSLKLGVAPRPTA